jgi:hypothetical protein
MVFFGRNHRYLFVQVFKQLQVLPIATNATNVTNATITNLNQPQHSKAGGRDRVVLIARVSVAFALLAPTYDTPPTASAAGGLEPKENG